VGLEQADRSVSLERVVFPEKVVLVLGREREGVPVEVSHCVLTRVPPWRLCSRWRVCGVSVVPQLIQELDICVEIPQFGVIRSLNVHVSAALLVWEYTRQRLLRR
jgi:tRNA G18 (ribose-2'-O)-methylase SpoU